MYKHILRTFPKNKTALQGLAALERSEPTLEIKEPPSEVISKLTNLYNQGHLFETVEEADILLQEYPKAFFVWNVLGVAHLKFGNVEKSLIAFKKVVKLNPNFSVGFNNLGSALSAQNKKNEAVKAYRKAISLNPSNAEAYYNMGNVLGKMGKLVKAIETYKTALSLQPNYAQAAYNLGIVFQNQGDLDAAIEAYKKVLSLDPSYVEAHFNLANALNEQGKLGRAIESYNKALSLKPDYAEAHCNMGTALKKQSKPEDAIKSYNKAIFLKPDCVDAYYNMSDILSGQGKSEEAIAAIKTAISLKPNFSNAYSNMGLLLKDAGKPEEAIAALKKAISLDSDNADAYNNLGVTLHSLNRHEEAIKAYRKTILLKPNFAKAFNNIGNVLKEQGKVDEAMEAYNQALSIKPDYALVHRVLSHLVKYKPGNPQIDQVEELLKRTDLDDGDLSHLHYALGKMKEDIGNISAAFENYVAGGRIQKKVLSYNLEQDEYLFNNTKIAALKIKSLQQLKPNKEVKHRPIFILGMPRSGTTLVEQIISSHPTVKGAGELPFLRRFGDPLTIGDQGISLKNLQKVRDLYLLELGKLSDGKFFVTDKMPQNFLQIGIIMAALPESKIIHVKREPAATCWSNFKHNFSTHGLGYSYDLVDTVSYFKLYQDLMHFWDLQYEGKIYHLDYDKLTSDFQAETRKVIEYLELGWNEACLFPHNNKRIVKTASQQQVREKIYKGSSQVWQKFEPYLKGAFKELE